MSGWRRNNKTTRGQKIQTRQEAFGSLDRAGGIPEIVVRAAAGGRDLQCGRQRAKFGNDVGIGFVARVSRVLVQYDKPPARHNAEVTAGDVLPSAHHRVSLVTPFHSERTGCLPGSLQFGPRQQVHRRLSSRTPFSRMT